MTNIPSKAPWPVALWIVFCAFCSCTGWILSALHQLNAAGYALACWTVNDAAAARRLHEWGADCLITDALRVIGPDFL